MTLNISYNFRRIKQFFNWTPLAVEKPKAVYMVYNDKERALVGFEVKVTYLYHGEHKLFFSVDDGILNSLPIKSSQEKANACYEKLKAKIEKANRQQVRQK